jgi:glycerol kinase
MSRSYILAIDQGTTNTKAALIDDCGVIVAGATQPVRQSYPQAAWVEQDPQELWQSVQTVIDACLHGEDTSLLAALAITNQRESILLWERSSGRPLGPCIGWQCRRTAAFCQDLKARGLEAIIHDRTGLMVDPLFSASKANWLLAHAEMGRQRAQRGELCLGTVDSWLLWNLTGEVHGCDTSNAARTQLLNIRTLEWDDELLALFEIPRSSLPIVRPSGSLHGRTRQIGLLPAGIPITGIVGDSHAALFGQAGFQAGMVKATYGTGSSLMVCVPTPVLSKQGLTTTVAWSTEDSVTYALEGNIAMAGAAVQWLGEFLGLADPARELAALATTVAGSDGLYFVPALVGLGAPYWVESARGLMTGFTQRSRVAHLARAALEAIAYQVRDVFALMEKETQLPLHILLADGGASQNDVLMQFQADLLGRPVLRSNVLDASILGAAHLAGLTIGLWPSLEAIEQLPHPRRHFDPSLAPDTREALYAGWKHAVAQTLVGLRDYGENEYTRTEQEADGS